MKKVLVLLNILFFSILKTYSQSDFRHGYVILNSGDTLHGFIDFRTNFSNSRHCFFRKDSISDATEYVPEQIAAYRFADSKYYVSKNITIEGVQKRVFLELLIWGKVKLYYSALEEGPNQSSLSRSGIGHYYIEKDTSFAEINNDAKVINVPGGYTKAFEREKFNSWQCETTTNQYIGMLKVYFRDCPEIYKKVDNTAFSRKSLIAIAKDYHERVCSDEQCIIYEKPASKRVYNFGLSYRYSFQNSKYYSSDYSYYYRAKQNSKLSFGIFATTNIDDDYRFWLQARVLYSGFNINDSILYSNVYSASFTHKFSLVTTDVTLKYRFSLAKIRPFAYAGIALGKSINDQFNLNITTIHLYTTPKNENHAFYGITGGAGLEYSINTNLNLFLSLSYDYYWNAINMELYGLSINTGIFF